MRFAKCSYCGTELEIDECDTMPGNREMEDVLCPECGCVVTRVFTSGIPKTTVVKKRGCI